MKNSKLLLIIIVSFFFLTNQIKATHINNEYISSTIGLLSLTAGLYKNQQIDYKDKLWEAYEKSRRSTAFITAGVSIFANTLFCSTEVSKKVILSYLISLLAIEWGSRNLAYLDNKKKEVKDGIKNGGLIGIGLGLLNHNFANYIASIINRSN